MYACCPAPLFMILWCDFTQLIPVLVYLVQGTEGDFKSMDNGDDQKHDSRLHRYVATDDESEDSSQDERNGITRHNDMRLLVDDVWRLARCHQLGFKRRVQSVYPHVQARILERCLTLFFC